MVDLHAHVLDGILAPEVELGLGDQHQGERNLIQNRINVLLDHATRRLELDTNLNCLQSRAKGLSTHELLSLGKYDL